MDGAVDLLHISLNRTRLTAWLIKLRQISAIIFGYTSTRHDNLNLSWANLTDNFTAGDESRGHDYWKRGKVVFTRWAGRANGSATLEANVSGSGRGVYEQTIDLIDEGDIVTVDGDCSCPVGYNCKHIVAALLAALESDEVARVSSATPHTPTFTLTPPVAPIKTHHRAASTRLPAPPVEVQLPYEIEEWLARLARARVAKSDTYAAGVNQRLLYIFEARRHLGEAPIVLCVKRARVLKSGAYNSVADYHNTDAMHNPPGFVLAIDQEILVALALTEKNRYDMRFALSGAAHGETLKRILSTGRCHYLTADSPPLQLGAPRAAQFEWTVRADGARAPLLSADPPLSAVISCAPPWYIDAQRSECGPLETGLLPSVAAVLVSAPMLPAKLVERVSREMTTRSLHTVVTPPQPIEETTLSDYRPTPILALTSHQFDTLERRTWKTTTHLVEIARLQYDYLGEKIAGQNPSEITRYADGKITRVVRNTQVEKETRKQLRELGFEVIEKTRLRGVNAAVQGGFVPLDADAEAAWMRFVQDQAPLLRERGWRVEMAPGFRFNIAAVDDWYGEVEESDSQWFNLEVGIEVEGERVSLIPILIKLIRTAPREWSPEALARRGDESPLLVPLPDGRQAALPLARVRAILLTLHELIMRDEITGNRLRLPALDAGRLADLEHALKLRWMGGERLRALGEKLAGFTGIAPVATPRGLKTHLRGYQSEGLAWLQFLREYELAGILADDKGLGKTVQALAHILIEKEAGRLDCPALVVAPTSMMSVWKSEATRFAPALKVLVSHGSKRKEGFEHIARHDLVVTTYALLRLDEEELKKHAYHIIVLDEAQNIKNAKTKAAAIAAQLKARHRLCLTGTPLENHLGELWSLFNFLLPGFLGDERVFRARYRTPIEKEGDSVRRDFLARRVKPFLLRRTKEKVAGELPPKTEITRSVELGGAQADLYETVRAAMDKRVREEIAVRGLARSHIIVLDALLKLRQICCDPRLVKALGTAKKPVPSAKLELLMEMLEELLDEGRSILLFSQFTSMLTLIEAELNVRKFGYVKLTGETRDRETPVKKFQNGEVKLFLISLKAGGTGLTLTAADTVIHYDPWWNPAVEAQATDRAHRIGQDKPVFVYKLIAKSTVEEKIIKLQGSKAALASGILAGEGAAASALSAEDLKALFEPLT